MFSGSSAVTALLKDPSTSRQAFKVSQLFSGNISDRWLISSSDVRDLDVVGTGTLEGPADLFSSSSLSLLRIQKILEVNTSNAKLTN